MKKKNPAPFLQDWGSYPHLTAVYIGKSPKEITDSLTKASKLKITKSVFEERIGLLKEVKKVFKSYKPETRGYSIKFPEHRFSIISLKTWAMDIENLQLLLHEICHLIEWYFLRINIKDEEAKAYLYQFLFARIVEQLGWRNK